MKILLLSLLVLGTAGLRAADGQPASPGYPITTCVVSDEPLGSMGKPYDYTHKEAGKPDRLVKFCCKMCVGQFKKAPAKYLAKLDAPPASKPAESPAPSTGHNH
jgi:hypothetical protein